MGYGLWFCGLWFVVVVLHRKIRLTQLWVELSWVVATTFLYCDPTARNRCQSFVHQALESHVNITLLQ